MDNLPYRLCRACHARLYPGQARWELHDRTLYHPHVYCMDCVRMTIRGWDELHAGHRRPMDIEDGVEVVPLERLSEVKAERSEP